MLRCECVNRHALAGEGFQDRNRTEGTIPEIKASDVRLSERNVSRLAKPLSLALQRSPNELLDPRLVERLGPIKRGNEFDHG